MGRNYLWVDSEHTDGRVHGGTSNDIFCLLRENNKEIGWTVDSGQWTQKWEDPASRKIGKQPLADELRH